PRARLLLGAVERLTGKSAALRTLLAIVKAMEDTDRGLPTVDTALVALALALGARPGTAAAFFALGRCAGWVAHVLEQRESTGLLQPRVRYVGPPPV
ncbi:MAG: citrate/2-methylcitrate synthase, partial [Myxococcales bacterium]|nr:citrate synthase [Polyangiaceae bacterium]MDW8250650.1 citrate/2-methylcitrate synthase [Myxococcales bacterium]